MWGSIRVLTDFKVRCCGLNCRIWTPGQTRCENAANYRRLFTDGGLTEQITLPVERDNAKHIYNQYVIRVPNRRDELRARSTDNGIGTDIYYPVPPHLQECFAYLGYSAGDMPESEKAAAETLALPIYPELTASQQEYVADTIADFFSRG